MGFGSSMRQVKGRFPRLLGVVRGVWIVFVEAVGRLFIVYAFLANK